MNQKQLILTRDFREVIAYPDVNFPLEIWTGNLNEYYHHELPVHYHDVFEFGYVLKGTVKYIIHDTEIILEKDDAIFVNSNVIHRCLQDEENGAALMYTVGFPPELIVAQPTSTIFQKYLKSVLYGNIKYMVVDDEIKVLLNTIYHDSTQDYNELHFLSLLIQLWEKTFDKLSHEQLINHGYEEIGEKRVKKMMNYIALHYGERITIDALASYAKISRNTCFRTFKQYAGKSPVEYLMDYRINQAAIRLRQSRESIINIAMECGFDNASYFGKIFKEKTGLTPLQYRKVKDDDDASK